MVFVHFFVSAVSADAEPRVEPIIGAVVFEGVTVFSPEPLAAVYYPVIGQALTPDTSAELTEKTRALYRDNGFLEPVVDVLPHPSVPGIVLIRVIEPRLSRIEVRSAGTSQSRSIKTALDPLSQQRPISKALIDNTIRRVETVQDIELGFAVESVDNAGNYRLTVSVNPKFTGALTYSSEGDRQLGRHLVHVQVAVTNPVSSIQKVAITALQTLESDAYRVGGLDVESAVFDRNTLSFEGRVGRALLKSDTTDAQTVYRFKRYRGEWAYSLAQTKNLDGALYTGLALRDYTRTREGIREVHEVLRIVDVGARALLRRDTSAFRIDINGRFGLDALGAGRSGSQAGDVTDVSFQIMQAKYTQWQLMPAGFSFRADIEAQYSPDNLPSSQRFTIGGSRFARAYEAGEFAGDNGIGGNLELRRSFVTDTILAARFTPFIYYGVATAYENQSGGGGSAAAAGLGLRVTANSYSGFLEYGKPLTANSYYRGDGARLNGRLTLHF